MRIACLGGGPAGLYAAISIKLRNPSHQVAVLDREAEDADRGWGVVFSDEALAGLRRNDAVSAAAIEDSLVRWTGIEVIRGDDRETAEGHGFAGIGRGRLLAALRGRARGLGVDLRFGSSFADAESHRRTHDLVVAADGLNSRCRAALAGVFRPAVEMGRCRYLWLGTRARPRGGFRFIFADGAHGWLWAHVYPFDADTSTFIVECSQQTWERYGFAAMGTEETLATCAQVFAAHLDDQPLMSNPAKPDGPALWQRYPSLVCETWHHENVVLLGDAAATGHFSIGSGTRLALDSAVALADHLHREPRIEAALAAYQQDRRPEVLRLQSAARNSRDWFEGAERYLGLDPVQFAYSLLTRSQRIGHETLRSRDPAWVGRAETWFQRGAGGQTGRAPIFAPFRLRGMILRNRIVVSPMAQYKAVDGRPTAWHLVHYGERAKGGAGLVCTEMTCISAAGRITPGCPGLYAPDHEAAWREIVDFIHRETDARICCQIGHAGRKGSTRRGWEAMGQPLPEGNWPLMSASALPWQQGSAIPAEMTRAQMEAVTAGFAAATAMAARAGFDMVELHAAHGYLVSSFISPLSNRRGDHYGGCLENRMRWPLEVLAAMRAAWPARRPISVRISAHDWMGEAGVTPAEAVSIARMLREGGADIIDVSSGQTSPEAEPRYGRMFQTPFADRIRHEAGVATMAVGSITTADQANAILLAGRADLVCLGRPHLADPYWTLNAALALDDTATGWPLPYLDGRDQARRLRSRSDGGNAP